MGQSLSEMTIKNDGPIWSIKGIGKSVNETTVKDDGMTYSVNANFGEIFATVFQPAKCPFLQLCHKFV